MFASGKPAGGGHEYVDRGDPAARDYAIGDFTADGTWRDLDLSSIVPAGAVAVALSVIIQDDAVNSTFQFRKNGNSNTAVAAVARTLIANVIQYQDLFVACDANRVIEYSATNLAWINLDVTVKGWWI